MAPDITVPVRTLAEYAYRSGSIESGFRTFTPLAEGTRIHKLVQEEYILPDQSEVHLEGELESDGLLFRLEGRCDGLRFEGDWVVIEEIKSTSGDFSLLGMDGHAVHWAQAVCYAYLYARKEALKAAAVRLLYVHAVTGERRSFVRQMDFAALEGEVSGLLACYAPYARQKIRHIARRTASAKELAFPYGAYRPGQRQLAGTVYKAVADKRKLFVRAPTGTGKTISTLFPAVKAVGEGLLDRLLYITARTTTRAAAEEALALMEEKGLRLRSVTLTAKEKICFREEVRCNKEACPYADGYYDRINGALLELLENGTRITRSVVEEYARKHRVCPFELSLDAAYEADAVIGDYNYVYDPRISLKRLWEEDKRKTAVLADEAHNLADRARDMYSAKLSKGAFLQLQRIYKGRSAGLHQAAKAVNSVFIGLRKAYAESGKPVLPEPPAELLPLLEEFCLHAERELVSGEGGGPGGVFVPEASASPGAGAAEAAEARNAAEAAEYGGFRAAVESAVSRGPAEGADGPILADAYYAAQSYIRAAGWYDERFVTYVEREGNDLSLRLYCLDPSAMLRQTAKGYRSQIFFSATLSPLGFYRELLGGEPEDYAVSIPSPFRREQLEVRLAPLPVRYREREDSIVPIAALLHGMVRERGGNTLAFFSSYDYMNKVHEGFLAKDASYCRVLLQRTGMTEEDRDAFLREFQPGPQRPLIAFAVLGGIFSEGIDLTGERLTGVAVVGVGLPQVGTERDLIKGYYDRTGRSGFDYAYVYPGMGKVLQAGGRLIRTEEDTGVLLLVDERFGWPSYQELLPEEWKPVQALPDERQKARGSWRLLYEPYR